MKAANRVQILNEATCISRSVNTLGKGMNPIILPQSIGKQKVRVGPSTLVWQPVKEKEALNDFIYIYIYIYIYISSCRATSTDNIYIYILCLLAWWLECSPMVRKAGVLSQVESYQRLKKTVLDASLLSTHQVRIKGKRNNLGKGVAPFSTTRGSSYWKGSFRVTLDYGRLTYGIYIYVYI